jgi:hypothetical protein
MFCGRISRTFPFRSTGRGIAPLLADLELARALLDALGLNDDADGRDVELDSERWRGLVSRVMNSQYELFPLRCKGRAVTGWPRRPRGSQV